MLKITLILAILSAIVFFIMRVIGAGMSTEEKVRAGLFRDYPLRLCVSAIIWMLLVLATIVCTIITIIKW